MTPFPPPPPPQTPSRKQLESLRVSSTAIATNHQGVETRMAALSKQAENASIHAEKVASEAATEVQSLKDALEGSRREVAQATEESREYSTELEVGFPSLWHFLSVFGGVNKTYFFVFWRGGLCCCMFVS